MATANDSGVKYKSITSQSKEHFCFRLSAYSKTAMENVYCIHCHKTFAYHGSNTSCKAWISFKTEFFLTKLTIKLIVDFQKVNY